MNLLDANDIQGAYPESWYAATTDTLPPCPPLEVDTRADVCVIGAGFTGLSAALHWAQAGRDVVLIDAHRVGFGASGRNGGQLGSGQRVEQPYLEKMLGMLCYIGKCCFCFVFRKKIDYFCPKIFKNFQSPIIFFSKNEKN